MRKTFWIVLIVIAIGIYIGVEGGIFGVEQPIDFSHKTHTQKVGLNCETCHKYVKKSFHAGLPKIEETCMMCHTQAQTDSPEEEKIRELAKRDDPPDFKKLFRFPNHVFYSHRRHVVLGGLECSTCHGNIAKTRSPPDEPLKKITMDFCIECHKREDVTTDCIACHI